VRANSNNSSNAPINLHPIFAPQLLAIACMWGFYSRCVRMCLFFWGGVREMARGCALQDLKVQFNQFSLSLLFLFSSIPCMALLLLLPLLLSSHHNIIQIHLPWLYELNLYLYTCCSSHLNDHPRINAFHFRLA
jgi:hypothetical protein